MGVSSTSHAASCCGGGAGTSVILPKFNDYMVDVSLRAEPFDGSWDEHGRYIDDPNGTDLAEVGMQVGAAKRLADRWQISSVIPFTRHENTYSGDHHTTQGIGDTSVSVWYEAFENVTCVYRITDLASLQPSVYLGSQIIIPTGLSRYSDRVDNNQEVTGRGFYRWDAQVMLEKTIYPWSASLTWLYGYYIERPVNQEYGRKSEPYQKQLGHRHSLSGSVGYTWFLPNAALLTLTGTYTDLSEGGSRIDGQLTDEGAFQKISSGLSFAYSTARRDWFYKLGYSQAERGYGTPKSRSISIGGGYVF